MASTNDIARLLNVDHRDSSAFADVIAEYFDDREADVYSSSDSEDGSGLPQNEKVFFTTSFCKAVGPESYVLLCSR